VAPSCSSAAFTALRLAASQFGISKAPGRSWLNSDRVLQRVNLADLFSAREIDQEADDRNGVARSDRLAGQGVDGRRR